MFFLVAHLVSNRKWLEGIQKEFRSHLWNGSWCQLFVRRRVWFWCGALWCALGHWQDRKKLLIPLGIFRWEFFVCVFFNNLKKWYSIENCVRNVKNECFDRWYIIYGGGFNYILCSPRTLGKMNPIWRAYFADGLEPTTSNPCQNVGGEHTPLNEAGLASC